MTNEGDTKHNILWFNTPVRIAITGGSGALGSALIEHLIADGAERIVTFTRCQHKRNTMIARWGHYPGIADRIYWHDLSDIDQLEQTFRRCEVVVHAAAAKVVGAHPDEPVGLKRTNITGTHNVLKAAERAGVRRVLVISSDKAVQPTNAYGVSKAYAEAIAVAHNVHSWPRDTRVSAIRYGNVLGSTGSVVPVFQAAVAKQRPIHLSDVRMTRFWLTLPQAVGHVLHAVSVMRGGEVFVPMLPAAPLVRVAEAVCGKGYPQIITGIRPGGEKLHEQLLGEDDVRRTKLWRGYYVVMPSSRTWDGTPWPGELVSPDLLYRSDVWPQQLSVEEIRRLLTGAV